MTVSTISPVARQYTSSTVPANLDTPADSSVTTSYLAPDQRLPLIVKPAAAGLDVIDWARSNKDFIEQRLLDEGGILLRGFDVPSTEVFEELIRSIGGPLLDYSYRSTPRSQVSGKIFTSTEYPADQYIPMHNEMAYTRSWPQKIGFCCLVPAKEGGTTPIADSRRVYERIDPQVRERFAQKGVMYVRNYGTGMDLSWQEVFQTDDRAEAEAFCRQSGIDFTWKDESWLRTTQICQGTINHPVTGVPLWFNQAHLFHVTSLPQELQEAFAMMFDEADLPRNTYYGDGTPIEPEVLEAIREGFAAETISFPWEQGDILLLDNMLVAHGRGPFVGPRRIVVGMAQAVSAADL
jgi:alpha-ketoglutarate-dependent taurine dioxygenase